MGKYAASIDDIRAAAERIKGVGHRTPILTSQTMDKMAGRKLFFKCENLQKVGAFKLRGGWNAVSMLNDEEAIQLTNEQNLEKVIQQFLSLGPKIVIIKIFLI